MFDWQGPWSAYTRNPLHAKLHTLYFCTWRFYDILIDEQPHPEIWNSCLDDNSRNIHSPSLSIYYTVRGGGEGLGIKCGMVIFLMFNFCIPLVEGNVHINLIWNSYCLHKAISNFSDSRISEQANENINFSLIFFINIARGFYVEFHQKSYIIYDDFSFIVMKNRFLLQKFGQISQYCSSCCKALNGSIPKPRAKE